MHNRQKEKMILKYFNENMICSNESVDILQKFAIIKLQNTFEQILKEKGGINMLVIRLFCNQGMSTSLLVSKMKEAAEKQGVEVDIAAHPANEMENRLDGVDCALLGPQVGYLKSKAAKICEAKGVPLDVIPMIDYGTCNGEKVLDFAKALAQK